MLSTESSRHVGIKTDFIWFLRKYFLLPQRTSLICDTLQKTCGGMYMLPVLMISPKLLTYVNKKAEDFELLFSCASHELLHCVSLIWFTIQPLVNNDRLIKYFIIGGIRAEISSASCSNDWLYSYKSFPPYSFV